MMRSMEHTIEMTGRLEPRSSWTADRCTIARTLEVISTRSAFLILREAFYGTTRFDDFAQRVGISEPVAAAQPNALAIPAGRAGRGRRGAFGECWRGALPGGGSPLPVCGDHRGGGGDS